MLLASIGLLSLPIKFMKNTYLTILDAKRHHHDIDYLILWASLLKKVKKDRKSKEVVIIFHDRDKYISISYKQDNYFLE